MALDVGSRLAHYTDGREIFYLSELRMMSVQVRTEPTFSHGTPEPLFGGLYQCCVGMSYDVAADGRFLMLKYTADFSTATFVPGLDRGTQAPPAHRSVANAP